MSIKAHTQIVTVNFGKTAKIGVIVGTNAETSRPVLMLAPIKKSVRGETIDPETDIKHDETKVILEFVSPKSIDVVIEGLNKVKEMLIEDQSAKLEKEMHSKLESFINGEQ